MSQNNVIDWSKVPLPGSYDALYAHFGNPYHPDFEKTFIVKVEHEVGGQPVKMQVHAAIAWPLHLVWSDLVTSGLVKQLHTFDGCWAIRPIRERTAPSLHSWALALDLNASMNALGTPGSMPAGIVAAFKAHGFVWGGEFHGRKDPMHFQWTREHTI